MGDLATWRSRVRRIRNGLVVFTLSTGMLALPGAVQAQSETGLVTVTNTEAGEATTGRFTFTLDGPNDSHSEQTTNDGGNGSTLTFDGLEPGTYSLCELVPDGYDSSLTDQPPTGGQECVPLAIDAGEARAFAVDNTPCPSGGSVLVTKTIPSTGGAMPVTFTYQLLGPLPSTTVVDTIELEFTGNETFEQGTLNTSAGLVGTFRLTESENGSNDKFVPNDPVEVVIDTTTEPVCADGVEFSNTGPHEAKIRVVKTETVGRRRGDNAIGRWTFTVTGGPGNVSIAKRTNTKGSKHVLRFKHLFPGQYTLCESFTGWRSNLGKRAGYLRPNGDRCVDFELSGGERMKFRVNNRCPLS